MQVNGIGVRVVESGECEGGDTIGIGVCGQRLRKEGGEADRIGKKNGCSVRVLRESRQFCDRRQGILTGLCLGSGVETDILSRMDEGGWIVRLCKAPDMAMAGITKDTDRAGGAGVCGAVGVGGCCGGVDADDGDMPGRGETAQEGEGGADSGEGAGTDADGESG